MPLEPVALFHAGPPKTATTWVYHLLKEHPQIVTSAKDTIHYFDMHFTRGEDWYNAQFSTRNANEKGTIRFDPTYSYICSPRAPARIAAYNPHARVMVCLRDPIERAFSHYWHIKKQSGDPALRFEDVLKHYNTYATWLEHGFVGIGLKALYDALPRENILILRFDTLESDPEGTYKTIADFAGLSADFRPSALHKKVNIAGAKTGFFQKNTHRLAKHLLGETRLNEMAKSSALIRLLSGKSEYIQGIDPEFRKTLEAVCAPEIQEIKRLTGVDLSP